MDSTPRHFSSRLVVTIVSIAVTLLAFYALSVGPAQYYTAKDIFTRLDPNLGFSGDLGRSSFYNLLFDTCENTPLEKYLWSYIDWWERRGQNAGYEEGERLRAKGHSMEQPGR